MDERPTRRGGWALLVVGGLALLLLAVVYVLSSAFAFELVYSGTMRRDTFDLVYGPLLWLGRNVRPLGDALAMLWEWWIAIRFPAPEPIPPPAP